MPTVARVGASRVATAFVVAGVLLALPSRRSVAQEATVTVPGTANLWLAGMPAGTTDGPFLPRDTAPAQSPVEVTGLPITPGSALTFRASGQVTHDRLLIPPSLPDGGGPGGAHNGGAAHGIARVNAPMSSLIGVFLGPDQPDLTPAPAAVLSFTTDQQLNYASISPLLKQPFFIGDGRDASGRPQQVVVPGGASRLFLGTSDSVDWYNNGGQFTVTAAVVPEPAAGVLAASAIALLMPGGRRTRRR